MDSTGIAQRRTELDRIRARRILKARAWLLSPALLLIFCFLILPLCIIVVYSFLTPGTYGGVVWDFSLESYIQFLFERDFFDDTLAFSPAYLQIYFRSFVQALVTTIVCFLIGFPTAYYIATLPERKKYMWVLLITVPYWINLLIRTIAMLFLIRNEGPLNYALISIGAIDEPIKIAYTNFGVGLGLIYTYLPFMVLPLYAAIERFDFRLVEASYDLYANQWTILRKIILPLVGPGIVAGCLLVFIPSLGSFIAPDLLGGGKKLMIGNLIALQFQGSRNWPFGSAAAVILMTMVLCALMVYIRQQSKSRIPLH
ncbi:MAG: ABC transporter permease [Gammaproteobacteria bacterium]|nr:ABC transporter permease [Gammaproteobacteria bacterium]